MNDKIIEDNMKSSTKNCISKGVDNQEKIKKDQINNTIAIKNEEEEELELVRFQFEGDLHLGLSVHSHIQHALYGCGVTHFSCDGVKITGKQLTNIIQGNSFIAYIFSDSFRCEEAYVLTRMMKMICKKIYEGNRRIAFLTSFLASA